MKKKSLMYKSLTQFIVCVAILLLLATPSVLLADQEFLCRGHNRYYRSRTARETGSGPRP